MKPAVLFARADSVYKSLECDVWDAERNRNQRLRRRPEVSKAEREHTPPRFAAWLLEVAKRCALQTA